MRKLKNLRELRERLALTQAEVAERAGVAESTYRYIENLEVSPRPPTVRKIAKAVGVDPVALWEDPAAPRGSPGRVVSATGHTEEDPEVWPPDELEAWRSWKAATEYLANYPGIMEKAAAEFAEMRRELAEMSSKKSKETETG